MKADQSGSSQCGLFCIILFAIIWFIAPFGVPFAPFEVSVLMYLLIFFSLLICYYEFPNKEYLAKVPYNSRHHE
jgi:hypothetical protein